MTTKKREHTRLRVLWLAFIKKKYGIYGWGGVEDFTDRMNIFREAILLAPNFTKRRGNKNEKYDVTRSLYLDEAESELRCKENRLEEWEFDGYVLAAPNYYRAEDDTFDPDRFVHNFYEIHPEMRDEKDPEETVSNL